MRDGAQLAASPDHGELHWRTVAHLALALDDGSADRLVLFLFGLFHDARRESEYHDPGHGARGGALARELHACGLVPVTAEQLELLVDACDRHTDGLTSNDPTTGRCWDADRLHLPRVGITPDAELYSTVAARLCPPTTPPVPPTWEELVTTIGTPARIVAGQARQLVKGLAHDREARPESGELVAAAVTATAGTIDRLTTDGLAHFRERNLQEIFVSTLRDILARDARAFAVKENLSLKLVDWPGVGPVDVSILKSGTPAALLELKWGAGTLYNCVWDLTKMATAIRRGTSRSAYLLAGAPREDWAAALGSELFEGDEWLLLRRYEKHWTFWRKDVKTRPLHLPAVVLTRSVLSVTLANGFELRCVEVLVPTDEWIDLEVIATTALPAKD
jgi:uncharacterized protein